MIDRDPEEREFARRLFADPDAEPAAEPDTPKRGNVVPREGSILDARPTGDEAVREWVNDLFTYSGVPWR